MAPMTILSGDGSAIRLPGRIGNLYSGGVCLRYGFSLPGKQKKAALRRPTPLDFLGPSFSDRPGTLQRLRVSKKTVKAQAEAQVCAAVSPL